MADVLELLVLKMMRHHHGLLWWRVRALLLSGRVVVTLLVLIALGLAHEVFRALVFVRATIILVSPDRLVDVTGGELVQLLVVAKDDDGDIDGAEDGQLVGLFEKTALALEEGDRAVPVVLDGFDLDLSAAHGDATTVNGSAWNADAWCWRIRRLSAMSDASWRRSTGGRFVFGGDAR